MSTATEEGMELAKSLDESLGRILGTELLLDSARDDLAAPAEVLQTISGLGLQGIAVDESLGGLGLPLADRVRLAAVLGRHLVPATIRDDAFAIAPALAVAAAGGSAEATDLLEDLLDGRLATALAIGSRFAGSTFALAPADAELVLLLGVDRFEAFVPGGDGLSITPLDGLDPGQGLSRVDLDGAAPLFSVTGPEAQRVRREFEVALACEAFGSAERTLELSAEYADDREQFGRPISSFQAVAHLLAEMKLGLETSRAGIGRYVDLDGEERAGDEELERWRATLAHSVPAAARRACEGAIQVHGGIGFSWELGLHLHYRRILADQFLLGGESASAEEIGFAYLERRRRT